MHLKSSRVTAVDPSHVAPTGLKRAAPPAERPRGPQGPRGGTRRGRARRDVGPGSAGQGAGRSPGTAAMSVPGRGVLGFVFVERYRLPSARESPASFGCWSPCVRYPSPRSSVQNQSKKQGRGNLRCFFSRQEGGLGRQDAGAPETHPRA